MNTNMTVEFRKAKMEDFAAIWEIIAFAIAIRKLDGSEQWQDGYPNKNTILADIHNGCGYVLVKNQDIVFYSAILFEIEPAYEAIKGNWLTNSEYCTVHRMAVAPQAIGQGLARQMLLKVEEFCLLKQIFSIKIDTNFDNPKMLQLIQKMDYSYCGKVYFRGKERKAFEKVLKK